MKYEKRRGAFPTPDELIERYILDDGGHARVFGGPHVWAIMFHIKAGDSPAQVAEDYELMVEEVRAAVAYYRRHKREIDGKLALNGA